MIITVMFTCITNITMVVTIVITIIVITTIVTIVNMITIRHEGGGDINKVAHNKVGV